MRVLFTTPAGLGHIHPMVPLAQAMVARGHDVLWGLPAAAVDHVERVGIRAVGASPVEPVRPADVQRLYPELNDLPPADVPDFMFAKLFGVMLAPPMLAGLTPLALEWRPDLVVSDAAELAGPIVAAELGVPGVTKGFGPLLPEQRVTRAAEEVAPLWRSRGLEPRAYAGCYDHLYLDIYPPGLQAEKAAHIPRRQLLRPVTDNGNLDTSAPPPLPDGRPGTPLVYVTMGTVFNDPGPLRVVLEALTDLQVRVLVTVGPQADPAVVGPQPAHVRVERYVPQAQVLPHCDVVISHAGSGTALSTLALGLPQLCLPQGADQFLNAAAIAKAGAGISLMPGEAGAGAVRDAVARLLDESSIRERARVVRTSIESMPAPEEVAEVLEELV